MSIETFSVFFISIAIHSWLCMFLSKRVTVRERFSPIARYLVVVANGLFGATFFYLLGSNPISSYIAISIIILAEVLILFDDDTFGKISVAFGILLHFFTCRAVVIAAHSLITKTSMYEILHNQHTYQMNFLAIIWVHILVLIAFITFVPPQAVKEIILNKLLRNFIGWQMIVLTLFFIYNSKVFSLDIEYLDFSGQQIALPIILLGTFYLMLIFMIKLVMADEYKKIISELEIQLDKNKTLADAVFSLAHFVIEINSTKNTVERVIIDSNDMTLEVDETYESFLLEKVAPIIYEEDRHLIEKMSAKAIKDNLDKGVSSLTFSYRAFQVKLNDKKDGSYVDSSEYLWHLMQLNSKLDNETGEIHSIMTVDEIHEQKEAEIALQNKAERDILTGAYNKEAVKARVENHLKEDGKGVLFIFDVDNFKGVNDNMGHAYGDEILNDIYSNIKHIFRSDDTIGRFGGDEFVAFIHNDTTIDEIERIADRICNTIDTTHKNNIGVEVNISTSIGISIAPQDGDNYEALFHAADIALYHSKNKGKNTFTIYNKNLKSF